MIWFVAFSPKKKWHFWARRFGHVSVFGFSNETWVHLDLMRGSVDVRSFHTFDDTNDYLSYMLTHYEVLKFGPVRSRGRSFFAPMTCVSFVKHTLGVNSRALRPDSLFRTLTRKYGAEIMNDPEGTERNAGTKTNTDAGGGG